MKKIENKFIVTTTIYNPSKALLKYSRLKNWQLIVVGDTKTPHNKYKKIKNLIYLTPEDQEKYLGVAINLASARIMSVRYANELGLARDAGWETVFCLKTYSSECEEKH